MDPGLIAIAKFTEKKMKIDMNLKESLIVSEMKIEKEPQ